MRGLMTRNRRDVEVCDLVFYEIKDVTGHRNAPLPGAHNMISCFGDNRAVARDPSLAPVDGTGRRAVRGERYFDWDWVCPSREEYRSMLLDEIRAAAVAGAAGIRLDTVGFPREGFCRCEACTRSWAATGKDWSVWRRDVAMRFVEEAASVAHLPLSLTLYPDPFPSHQLERFGLDLDALRARFDLFVVPIYDLHYATTHWLETLVLGFRDVLQGVPFYVELYALNVDLEALKRAAQVCEAYAAGVLFAYENRRTRIEELLTAG